MSSALEVRGLTVCAGDVPIVRVVLFMVAWLSLATRMSVLVACPTDTGESVRTPSLPPAPGLPTNTLRVSAAKVGAARLAARIPRPAARVTRRERRERCTVALLVTPTGWCRCAACDGSTGPPASTFVLVPRSVGEERFHVKSTT